jgi:hypothetical protein
MKVLNSDSAMFFCGVAPLPQRPLDQLLIKHSVAASAGLLGEKRKICF